MNTENACPWDICKKELEGIIPNPFYQKFINSLHASYDPASNLRLIAPSNVKDHIRFKYLHVIEQKLQELDFHGQVTITDEQMTLQPTTSEAMQNIEKNTDCATTNRTITDIRIPGSGQQTENPAIKNETEFALICHKMNQKQIEKIQHLAFPASAAFISGRPGSGKTHLARMLCEKYPRKSRYYTLESFIEELAHHAKARSGLAWKKELKSLRVIVIDNFQFIKATAKRTHEEVRFLIDEFERSENKLILISDRPVSDLTIDDDLKSRLHCSFQLEMLIPEAQSRKTILQNTANAFGITLPDPLADYLSEKVRSDIRKLKSIPMRIAASNLALHEDPAKESAGQNEQDPLRSQVDILCSDLYDRNIKIDGPSILAATCRFFQISQSEVTGPCRSRKATLARHLTAYLCQSMLSLRLSDIAEIIGRKDHTSVIHAIRKIENLKKSDLFFTEQIEQIKSSIERL